MNIDIDELINYAKCNLLLSQEKAKSYLISQGLPGNKNACASTLSALINGVCSQFPMIAGAQDLADYLEKKINWKRIEYKVSEIQPGDIGVCADQGHGLPGADHIYLVISAATGSDTIFIADNQNGSIHERSISGNDHKTPTEYFLRKP